MPSKAAATTASSGRREKTRNEGSSRSRRTAYTCTHHPTIYVCKEGLGQCWLEHLADCGDEFVVSDHSDEDIDGGDPDL